MSVLAAMLRHELRACWRLRRIRVLVALNVAVTLLPVVGLALAEGRGPLASGWMLGYALLPFLRMATFATAFFLAVDLVPRDRHEGSFAAVAQVPASNAGFVLVRLVVACVIVTGLAAVPLTVAWALSSALPAPAPDATKFVTGFLLDACPAVLLGASLGLGFGILLRTALAALIGFAIALAAVQSFGNDLLARFGLHVASPATWLVDGERMASALGSVFVADQWWQASDAPRPWSHEWPTLLATLVPLLVVAGPVLAAAIALLQRTAPDVRPRPLRPGHPLPTVHRALNALRQVLAPEPALGWRDGVTALVVLAVAAAGLGWHAHRTRTLRAVLDERLRAEGGPPPAPLDPGFEVVAWSVDADVDGDGRVVSATRIELLNASKEPASHVAFSLNPFLSVTRATARDRPLVVERAWDRVTAELSPPVAPGETVVLSFGTTGVPSDVRLPESANSFQSWYRGLAETRVASELSDLARDVVIVPRVAPRFTRLRGRDLGPVPRHGTWELVSSGSGPMPELIVVPDLNPQVARVRLSLRVRGFGFLADSCGHVAQPRGDVLLLEGECSSAPALLEVAGGRLRALDVPAGAGAIAVMPSHAAAAAPLVDLLPRMRELAAGAWPSLPVLDLVLLEMPPDADSDVSPAWTRSPPPGVDTAGALVYLQESGVLTARGLDSAPLVADAVTRALMRRRRLPEHRRFIEAFVERVVLSRLSPQEGGAVIPDAEWHAYQDHLFDYSSWRLDRSRRLGAVIGAVEAQVGREMLVEGTDRFLSGEGEPTVAGLFGSISRAGGRDLSSLMMQFVEGNLMPQLTLQDVTFERSGDAWRARGTVANQGTGEVTCPVVLYTDVDTVTAEVRVAPGAPGAFDLVTRNVPRRVALDPAQRCFRTRPRFGRGIVESADFGRKP